MHSQLAAILHRLLCILDENSPQILTASFNFYLCCHRGDSLHYKLDFRVQRSSSHWEVEPTFWVTGCFWSRAVIGWGYDYRVTKTNLCLCAVAWIEVAADCEHRSFLPHGKCEGIFGSNWSYFHVKNNDNNLIIIPNQDSSIQLRIRIIKKASIYHHQHSSWVTKIIKTEKNYQRTGSYSSVKKITSFHFVNLKVFVDMALKCDNLTLYKSIIRSTEMDLLKNLENSVEVFNHFI